MKRLATVAFAWLLIGSTDAWAEGRESIEQAYAAAAKLIGKEHYKDALALVEGALAQAEQEGLRVDPAVAPLVCMRGALLYAIERDAGKTLAVLGQAVAIDHHVRLPAGLRGKYLRDLIGKARSASKGPGGDATHQPPGATPGQDLSFEILFHHTLTESSTASLHWRKAGADSYERIKMHTFGNLATATVTAEQHGDASIEYLATLTSKDGKVVARVATREAPLRVEMPKPAPPAVAVAAGATSARRRKQPKRAQAEAPDETQAEPEPAKAEPAEPTSSKKSKKSKRPVDGLDRFFFQIGIGTGIGIGRGRTEETYDQYFPGEALQGEAYGTAEQACALERWYAGGTPLAGDTDTFDAHLREIQTTNGAILPAEFDALVDAYSPDACSRRQSLGGIGVASAPLHIAPEFGVRIGRAMMVSVFGRLQVVTGSKVYTEDQTKPLLESYDDVRAADPEGVRLRVIEPSFTFAVGAKFKYFFGRDASRLRPYLGAFIGYGFARLRAPLDLANDRNGNSVPDDREAVNHGEMGEIGGACVPVWPYNAGCEAADNAARIADEDLVESVRASAAGDQRVDTLKLGPGFGGILVGLHYQIVNHFGFWAELQLGAWFPNTTTGLADITIGPSITF